VAIDFDVLIAKGDSAALDEPQRRWGPGVFRVRGQTRRGCRVHLTVERAGVEVAHWRYELDGRLTEETPSAQRQPG
jgi:hypothetical protein